MKLNGIKVILKPMTTKDKLLFYRMATRSSATPLWYGKLYENKVPTKKQFFADWEAYYFSDKNPKLGRCFLIMVNKKTIGEINYNRIINGRTEIDIIITDQINQGKGYGPDAIRTLVGYLFSEMNVREVWVAAINKNQRAIKAYKKAGFRKMHPSRGIERHDYWRKQDINKWTFLSIIRE